MSHAFTYWRRPAALGRATSRRLLQDLEWLVLPHRDSRGSGGDFRRVVTVVAMMAVGFFVPSLVLAGVPVERWPTFLAVATVAGLVLAGSFFSVARRPEVALAIGVLDAMVVGLLGWLLKDYYHEIPLLFVLIVAALAVVHGLSAALPAVVAGAVLLPTVMAAPGSSNLTDPINAAIYLFGGSVVPWAVARLARSHSDAVQSQLRATRATEREAVLILARAAEAKDEVTGNHVARVGDLSAMLAEATGSDAAAIDAIRYAAMLHDVGKLHIPDRILLKPTLLTAEEWAVMRRHTILGQEILGGSAGFELARTICRSHHENWDGSGYPDGLRAHGIPLEARIVRITDTFDALRNARPYKPAWPLSRCLEELEAAAGAAFDPELTRMFLPLVEKLHAPEPLLIARQRSATAAS